MVEAAKADRSQQRKERAVKAVKMVGNMALKSALTGATIAAKVVFSSAITSATLVGIAAAGYATLTSPEVSQLLDQVGAKAGNWISDRYIRKGAAYANQNLDQLLLQGNYYLKSLKY